MPSYTFNVRRSGELAVPCSVPWRLEGVGANPMTPELFAGGVLPSGVASFAAGETSQPASFATTAGAQPFHDLDGRLLLHTPTGCKLDPLADRHALLMVGTTPPPVDDLYEPIRLADLPPSRRTNVTSLGTRTGVAGMNFVLTSDVSNATLTLGGAGKLGQEVVFRGDTDSSAATGLRTLTNCRIDIVGDFCGLARLVLRNCQIFVNNRSCFVTRCEITDFSRISRSDTILDVDALAKAARFSCHKNDFTNRLGPNKGCILYQTIGLEIGFAYNLVERHEKGAFSDSTYLFFYGESESTTNVKSLFNVHHNLFVDCDVVDLVEVKASDMDWHDNTIERCGGSGVRIRHGMRNRIRRNLFLEAANNPLITVRTGPHEIVENQFKTGSGGPGEGKIALFAGKLHWDYAIWKDQRVAGKGNNWQASGHCTVLANLAGIINGFESGTSDSPPEVRHGYYADGNNLGPTSGASRNRAVTETPYVTGTLRQAVAGYDIDTVLSRMVRGNVGLRAP